MKKVFLNISHAFVNTYLNGTQIYSKTLEDWRNHLKINIRKLKEESLLESYTDANLFVSKEEYPGPLIANSGVLVAHQKEQAVKDWQIRNTKKTYDPS